MSSTMSNSQRDQQIEALFKGGLTLQEVGDKYGLTRERIRQVYIKKTGVNIKNVREIQQELQYGKSNCEYCGKEYVQKHKLSKYCSYECRRECHFYTYNTINICKVCGLGFSFQLTKRNRSRGIYCSKICWGKEFGEKYGKHNLIKYFNERNSLLH